MRSDFDYAGDVGVLDETRLPATYEAAKQALAECHRLDEVKTWSDKAVALAAYAAQAQDEELELFSRRIRNRAVRRMGELMQQVEPGVNQHGNSGRSGTEPTSRKDAAHSVGISERQRKDAQVVASIPEQEFEEMNEQGRPATVTEMVEYGRGKAPSRKPSQKSAAQAFIKDLTRVQMRLAQWHDVVPLMTAHERKQASQAAQHIERILSEVEW